MEEHRFTADGWDALAARPVRRRTVLTGIVLAPLASMVPGLLRDQADAAPGTYRFFNAHQGAVVVAATARLVPGPTDDPTEIGHPGAREANVVRYIDTMLSVFSFSPARVHAGGPWSNRSGGSTDYMAEFVPLDRAQTVGWKARVAELQQTYRTGIAALDAAASTHDFTAASTEEQDQILIDQDAFRSQLFTNTIEGMYAIPEYGGNAGLVGWKDIGFPGDSQPRGYTADEVERSDGVDPVAARDLPIAQSVLKLFPKAAGAVVSRGFPRGRRPDTWPPVP